MFKKIKLWLTEPQEHYIGMNRIEAFLFVSIIIGPLVILALSIILVIFLWFKFL